MDMHLCKSEELFFREISRNYYRHSLRQHHHKTAALPETARVAIMRLELNQPDRGKN